MVMTTTSSLFADLLPAILFLTVIGILALLIGDSETNPVIRVLWFVFFGWWLGLIWLGLSIALMMTIIFLPIGAYAATKTWKIMTLSGSKGPKDAVSDVSVDVENKVKQEVDSNSNSKDSSGKQEEKDREEDDLDKLERLKELKEDGVLTEEEFKKKKEDILGDL